MNTRPLTLAALLAAMSGAPTAIAQPDAHQITTARAAAQTASDADRPLRLVELAEALLAQLAADSADLAAIYAIPTAEQRDRANAHAEEAAHACTAAAPLLITAADALAARPDFPDRPELQDLRSKLLVEVGELRLPRAHARAAAILAGLAESEPERRAHLAQIDRLLKDADFGAPAAEAERLILLGLARPALLDEALRLAPPTSRTRVEAILAIALTANSLADASAFLAPRLREAPFTRNGEPDPALHVLAAATQTRVGLREAAMLSGAARDAAVERAMAPLTDAATTLGPTGRRAALAVCAAAPGAAPSRLAAIARVATGESLDIPAIHKALDLARGDDAISTLAALVLAARLASEPTRRPAAGEQTEIVDIERGALDAIAAALDRGAIGPVDRPAAAAHGVQLALRTAPTPGRRAPSSWLESFAACLKASPVDPATNRLRLSAAEFAPHDFQVADILAPIAASDPDSFARARVTLAASVGKGEDCFVSTWAADRFRESMTHIEQARAALARPGVSADTREWGNAQLAIEEIKALQHFESFDEDAERRRRSFELLSRSVASEAIVDRHADALLRLAALQVHSASISNDEAKGRDHAPLVIAIIESRPDASQKEEWIPLAVADAYRVAGRPAEALALLTRLIKERGPDAASLLVRAHTLRDLGRVQEAFADVVSIAGGTNTPPTPQFWPAARLLLEILESQNKDGARAPAIRREIARLRAIDPALGGGPDGEAIAALEQRVNARP